MLPQTHNAPHNGEKGTFKQDWLKTIQVKTPLQAKSYFILLCL